MTLSKNAIGNLVARYTAVLKRCAVLNLLTVGLVFAGASGAMAETAGNITTATELGYFITGNSTVNPSWDISTATLTANLTGDQKVTASFTTAGNEKSKTLNLGGKKLEFAGDGLISVADSYVLTVVGATTASSGKDAITVSSGVGFSTVTGGTLALDQAGLTVDGGSGVNMAGGTLKTGASGSFITVASGTGVGASSDTSNAIAGASDEMKLVFDVSSDSTSTNACGVYVSGSTSDGDQKTTITYSEFNVDGHNNAGIYAQAGNVSADATDSFVVGKAPVNDTNAGNSGVFVNGGAAAVTGSAFTVCGGTFADNKGGNAGVSVANGSATVSKATFNVSSSADGNLAVGVYATGALDATPGTATVEGSTFVLSSNGTITSGEVSLPSAVGVAAQTTTGTSTPIATVTVSGAKFTGNGTAVFAGTGGTVYVSNADFSENTGVDLASVGGAVLVSGNQEVKNMLAGKGGTIAIGVNASSSSSAFVPVDGTFTLSGTGTTHSGSIVNASSFILSGTLTAEVGSSMDEFVNAGSLEILSGAKVTDQMEDAWFAQTRTFSVASTQYTLADSVANPSTVIRSGAEVLFGQMSIFAGTFTAEAGSTFKTTRHSLRAYGSSAETATEVKIEGVAHVNGSVNANGNSTVSLTGPSVTVCDDSSYGDAEAVYARAEEISVNNVNTEFYPTITLGSEGGSVSLVAKPEDSESTNVDAIGIHTKGKKSTVILYGDVTMLLIPNENLTTSVLVGDGIVVNNGNLTLLGDNAASYSVSEFTGTYTQNKGKTDFSPMTTVQAAGSYNIEGGEFVAKKLEMCSGGSFNVGIDGKSALAVASVGEFKFDSGAKSVVTVNKGATFAITNATVSDDTNTRVIKKDTLTKDSFGAGESILEAGYSDAIQGKGGTVVLYLTDKQDEKNVVTYTSAALLQAGKEMFANDTDSNSYVAFEHGVLKISEGDAVVAGTEKTSEGVYTMTTPAVVVNGETSAKDSKAAIIEHESPIQLVDQGTTSGGGEPDLVPVKELNVDGNTFKAPALQADTTDMGIKATNSSMAFTGENPVIGKDEAGAKASFNLKNSIVAFEKDGTTDLLGGSIEAASSTEVTAAGDLKAGGVKLESGSSLNVAGDLNLSSDGELTVDDAKATVAGLDAGTVKLEDGGALSIIGTEEKPAKATIGRFDMKSGASFFIDPAYVSVDALVDNEIKGDVVVGEASTLAISAGKVVEYAASQNGWEDVSGSGTGSALILGTNVTVASSGNLIVDPTAKGDSGLADAKAHATGYNVWFGANAILAVDGSELKVGEGDKAAITTSGNAYIDGSSKLYIACATGNIGDVYNIIDADKIDGGWSDGNIYVNQQSMLSATYYGNGNVIISKAGDAKEIMKGLDGELVRLVDNLYDNGLHDASDSAKPGIKFLSRASDGTVSAKDGVNAIESVSRIGALGAVPQMSIMASESLTDAVANRMSIANGVNAIQEQMASTGLALWITPQWKNQSGFGLEACNFNNGFVGNMAGVALGLDYAFNPNWKAGLAFNIGGGYATSNGDLQETDNNMTYWGLGVYGGYNDGTLSAVLDVAYTGTYNKLEQSMVDGMGMKKANADVQASLWTVGLRGDYKFALDALDITPHVGIRMQSLSSQEYDIKAGGTVAKSDGLSQTIWSVPVGVAFGKDFATSGGWKLTPSVDFTVTPRFGDLKVSETVKFTGVPGDASLNTQTRDYITYKGSVGFGAKYDNIGLNLNYSYEGGSCTSSHGVNATFKWEF